MFTDRNIKLITDIDVTNSKCLEIVIKPISGLLMEGLFFLILVSQILLLANYDNGEAICKETL
jgi:hypothetical protein